MRTRFINKEIEVPDDLHKYLELLDLSQNSISEIFERFTSLISHKTVFMEDIIPALKDQTSKYISILCLNGVFNQGVEEYMEKSYGYNAIAKTIEEAFAKFCDITSDEIDDLMKGMDVAQASAESKVTGSGISVWSSSATTLLSFAAVDYFSAKSQIKQAQKEYQSEMNRITSNAKSRSEERKKRYTKDVYMPNMFDAISAFVFGVMDNCLSDLSQFGAFDETTLDFVNIKKSTDLLHNLTLSNNSEQVLVAAFEACPFNIRVFLECAEKGFFTSETLSFLRWVGKAEIFEQEIKKKYGILLGQAHEAKKDKERFLALLSDSKMLTSVMSLLSGKTEKFYFKEFGKTIYRQTVEEFSYYKACLESDEICYRWYSEWDSDSLLKVSEDEIKVLINKQIKTIISEELISALINVCGYQSLLNDIAPDGAGIELSKGSIDNYYVEQCSERIARLLPKVKESIEAKNKKQHELEVAEEIANAKKEKKFKVQKALLAVLLIVIYLIPITIHIINTSKYVSEVKQEVSAIIENGLRRELGANDSYASEIMLKKDFVVKSVEFYGYGSDISYIVANVDFYSNTKDIWEVHASLAISDVFEYLTESKIKHNKWTTNYLLDATIVESNGTKVYVDQSVFVSSHDKIHPYISTGWVIGYIVFAIVMLIVYAKVCDTLRKKLQINNIPKMNDPGLSR